MPEALEVLHVRSTRRRIMSSIYRPISMLSNYCMRSRTVDKPTISGMIFFQKEDTQ